MQLAKQHVDVAVMTNHREPMLSFWQETVGLPFEELLPTGGGNHQLRHALNGSVFKLNHARDPLPVNAPTGVRALWIAREGQLQDERLVDPDGNAVWLVAPGTRGIGRIAIEVAVRDLRAQARFYTGALGFEAVDETTFRCGDTLFFVREDPDAPLDAGLPGTGVRYITIQVFDCEAETRRILEHGGREGAPARRMGDVAVFSMVRDPAGNWIEISQRRSLTGSLERAGA